MKILMACLVVGTVMPGIASAQGNDGPLRHASLLTVHPRHPLEVPAPVASRAAPVAIPLDPTGFVRFMTPFTSVETPAGPALVRIPHYQGPDGAYDTPADLTNAINGVPCGVECTARSLARWGYQP